MEHLKEVFHNENSNPVISLLRAIKASAE